MALMVCTGCELIFDGERERKYSTVKCPVCKSGMFVVRMSHPMARKFSPQVCESCKDGIMVKIAEVRDQKGRASMNVMRCQSCGHKKPIEKKVKHEEVPVV